MHNSICLRLFKQEMRKAFAFAFAKTGKIKGPASFSGGEINLHIAEKWPE